MPKGRAGYTAIQVTIATRNRLNQVRRQIAAQWDRDVTQAELIARLTLLASSVGIPEQLAAVKIDKVDPAFGDPSK